MITKNNLITGSICGLICVAFMWTYMYFTRMQMTMSASTSKNTHIMRMPDGSMMEMSNDGNMMMKNGSIVNTDLTSKVMDSMTMNDMVSMMKGKKGEDLEKEFLIGMIPHHQGAVDMAKLLLQDKTVSPQVAKFAEDIIKAQEGEIKMMNEWLKKY